MKSYLLLGILLLYYLCIDGRSAEIKEESDNPSTNILSTTLSKISLQNITRLNRSSLGGRVQTDHLGRNRIYHRRRVQTRRRRTNKNKPKHKHSL
uniref:GEO13462p1 n=2 Tax=Drosophila melanogaster TaxID=7227 RepID=A0A0B4K6U8_DROME|eukprot:NP_001247363.1 uncharacterized protein Dmel_CG43448 [Drosophila melanogaster]